MKQSDYPYCPLGFKNCENISVCGVISCRYWTKRKIAELERKIRELQMEIKELK